MKIEEYLYELELRDSFDKKQKVLSIFLNDVFHYTQIANFYFIKFIDE